jgi:hypothetical protein
VGTRGRQAWRERGRRFANTLGLMDGEILDMMGKNAKRPQSSARRPTRDGFGVPYNQHDLVYTDVHSSIPTPLVIRSSTIPKAIKVRNRNYESPVLSIHDINHQDEIAEVKLTGIIIFSGLIPKPIKRSTPWLKFASETQMLRAADRST